MDSQNEAPAQKGQISQTVLIQIKELLNQKQDKTQLALRALDIGTMLFFVLLANKESLGQEFGPLHLLANATLMTMGYNLADNMFSLPRGAISIGLLGYWSWKSLVKK